MCLAMNDGLGLKMNWWQLERLRGAVLAGVVAGVYVLCSGSCLVGKTTTQSSNRVSSQISEEDSSVEVTRAREKAKAAKRRYERVKELGLRGSASQKDVRDAKLFKYLAFLELSDLVSPSSQEENSLLRATLVFNYQTTELEITQSLFQRGAASELEFQRAKTARDVAESRLKAARSETEAQRKFQIIKVANTKLQSAEQEYRLAQKLFSSGSITPSTMEQATSNLKIAKSELSEAKESLGARAIVVEQ